MLNYKVYYKVRVVVFTDSVNQPEWALRAGGNACRIRLWSRPVLKKIHKRPKSNLFIL